MSRVWGRFALVGILLVVAGSMPLAAGADTGDGGGVPGDARQLTPTDGVAIRSVISPDGATIVYAAVDIHGNEAVYARPTGGGPETPLSGLVFGGNVSTVTITPDGQTVVYVADHNVAQQMELWAVPIGGGQRVRLSGPMIVGGDVRLTSGLAQNVDSLLFTPDSSKVVFTADSQIDDAVEVFVADLSGGEPTKLHADFEEGAFIRQWELTSDSTEVLYVARTRTDARYRLYKAALTGPPAMRLSPLTARVVDGFLQSRDGETVYWDGVNDQIGKQVLMAVPVAGGASIQLSGSTVNGGNVSRYAETGDGAYVAYLASQDDKNVAEVYSAATDGSGWIKLNPTLVAGGQAFLTSVSPIDSTVVYRADQDSNNVLETYMVDASGGDVTKLNPPLTGTQTGEGVFDPTGAHIIFTAETGQDGAVRLYRANPANGNIIWINDDIGDLDDIEGDIALGAPTVRFTPDGKWVLYLARPQLGDPFDLIASRTNGSGSRQLSTPGLGAGAYVLSPQGTHVRYNPGGVLFYTTIVSHRCGGKPATHAGTPGHDNLVGTDGKDVMVGFGGNDVIDGLEGSDTICGGTGNDHLFGGIGPDTLLGGKGNDRLDGMKGDDTIFGHGGRDLIWGRLGRDVLHGGGGDDTLRGGGMADFSVRQCGSRHAHRRTRSRHL